MNPLRIAAGVVSLLSEMVAREYRKVQLPHWPDGEQPLIDDDKLLADALERINEASAADPMGTRDRDFGPYCDTTSFEPMPGWFRGGFDEDSSAGSAAPEAGVDSGEGPTPGRAHTPGVGHPFACAYHRPVCTASLLISAAIGLREYVKSDACEAPTYWSAIADQLNPK